VGGLVGSRLDFIIENYSDVKHDLLGNIFSGSGLVWYGGVIGGALGVFLWAWWRGFLTLALLDVAAPALALGSPATATTARPGTAPGRWRIRTAPSRPIRPFIPLLSTRP
jgi:Prolipoprotein diacylglyceryl transferase